MIAVYSLWNMGDASNSASFNTVDDLMVTMKLSMLQSKKYFDRIVLVTDRIGAGRAVEYELPCEVITALDDIDVKPIYWAMAKLKAMCMITEPFVHIDNDFILWKDPKPLIGDADFCFQNKEEFAVYDYYTRTLEEIRVKSSDLFGRVNKPEVQFAYNCGLIACRNIEVMKEWRERASAFIDEADALPDFSNLRGCFNHLLEQYIITLIVTERSLKVNVMLQELDMNTKLFTHLWGVTKKNQINMDGVRNKLNLLAY